ncbi:MAG TPA: NAD-dependent epimerase/dehydratase family protein [Terriglobales bacterium]|jgi:GDP-L-fucose synthase|nr:NAD-dependent epimerase/dehydratase family protein [Terriglobales bacterium]
MQSADFWKKRRVVICGGQGFLGGQVMRRLLDLQSDAISCSRRAGTDLRDLDQGIGFFRMHEPEVVINCAANQGGIAYQKLYPGSIYYDNLLMGANTMEAARLTGVKKYVNIIAGCAYPGEPRDGVLREEEFEAGPMHPTVENYGATKRAAVLQAKYYRRQYGFDAISLILVNLYGPSEHFHPDRSHALAALIRKFYEAKRDRAPEVVLWGTGRAVREWMYVTDAADGIVRASERYAGAEPLNLAVGHGQTIAELANIIKAIVKYEGRIVYDSTMPDGALQKVGDTTRMRAMLDWEPQVPILEGIKRTLDWFAAHYEEACGR